MLATLPDENSCAEIWKAWLFTNSRDSLKRKSTTALLALAKWLEKQFGSHANEVVSGVLDAGLSSSIGSGTDEGNQILDSDSTTFR